MALNHPRSFVLTGGTVVNYDRVLRRAAVFVENGMITDVKKGDGADIPQHIPVIEVKEDHLIFPGFIDVHIHGAAGADVMDAKEEALSVMARTLPREGTTSFLATTITQHPDRIERAVRIVGEYMRRQQQSDEAEAEILGIHLEGPFISRQYPGAQPIHHITEPDMTLFEQWQQVAGGTIRLVTLAPEIPNALELIRYLHAQGVIVSAGHSDATLAELEQAWNKGLTHITHLYNAMGPMHHREPGLTGAVLLNPAITAEIIFDGIHVAKDMIQLAFNLKGSGGLELITDAIRAKCLNNGMYELAGQSVHVRDGEARLPDGTLAGSVLKMNEAVKNAATLEGCQLTDLVRMSSYNAALELGVLDRKGRIEKGKDADLVIMNRDFQVQRTYCRGLLAYQA